MQKFKCVSPYCNKKAYYNYKTRTNPGYCYYHKTQDMIKIEKDTLYDKFFGFLYS